MRLDSKDAIDSIKLSGLPNLGGSDSNSCLENLLGHTEFYEAKLALEFCRKVWGRIAVVAAGNRTTGFHDWTKRNGYQESIVIL